MGYRSRKSFEEKATEYERLKAIGHQIVDQMTRIELQRFCRRKYSAQQQIEVKEQTQ
jgi:hypothetical protein